MTSAVGIFVIAGFVLLPTFLWLLAACDGINADF